MTHCSPLLSKHGRHMTDVFRPPSSAPCIFWTLTAVTTPRTLTQPAWMQSSNPFSRIIWLTIADAPFTVPHLRAPISAHLTPCYDSFHARSRPRPCVHSTPDRSPMFHRERAPRCVASRDPLPSRAPARRANASWYARPLEVRAGSLLPAL